MADHRSAHKAARDGKPLPKLPPCHRCEHSPDDHHLDDSLNVSPTDPAAKFRCVVDGCGCPDYAERAPRIAREGRPS